MHLLIEYSRENIWNISPLKNHNHKFQMRNTSRRFFGHRLKGTRGVTFKHCHSTQKGAKTPNAIAIPIIIANSRLRSSRRNANCFINVLYFAAVRVNRSKANTVLFQVLNYLCNIVAFTCIK